MTETIFVSGGSRGIGEAIVKEAAGKYNVAFTYNSSRERALKLQDDINARHGGALALKCDVADPRDVENAVSAAKKRFGNIDILVNNAGIALEKLLVDTSYEEWRRIMAVNLDGTYCLTRAVLKDMLSKGKGSIVNVSSVWGIGGASMEVAYSASKAAVIGFTKALAKEVAPMGVRVNAVAPGAIDTDMLDCFTKEELSSLVAESIPLGRLGRPEEVAAAVLFLAEQEYISGSVLPVTGLLS